MRAQVRESSAPALSRLPGEQSPERLGHFPKITRAPTKSAGDGRTPLYLARSARCLPAPVQGGGG